MKTTHQITIAIPGETRNGQNVRSSLMEMWLMYENDMNLDIFNLKWIPARIISLRASDAIKFLLGGTIHGIINGDDILTDFFLSQGKRPRREEGEIVWFDTFYSSSNSLYTSQEVMRKDERQNISRSFLLDTISPVRLKVLTRSRDESIDLESIAQRGNILTSYPYLVRMLLANKFSGSNVWKIQKTEGKIEAQLAIGIGTSGVDIVDTGKSARKNNLIIGETLFKSVPVWVFRDRDIAENTSLRNVVNILIDATNTAYYNSPTYRKRYPRG